MAYDSLGLHVIGGTTLPLGRARLWKGVNVSPAYVGQVRHRLGPDAMLIIRFEHDDPEIGTDPEGVAAAWFNRRLVDMRAMRAAAGNKNIAFELPKNEPPTSLLPVLVPFYRALIPLAQGQGFNVVVGNPGVGEWHHNEWHRFASVIAMLGPADFLGLHEYWSDHADIDNRWHCARWSIPQINAVISKTPIAVTECGRDRVEGKGQAGWKRSCNAEEFLDDLRKYNRLLEQWPQVLGATVFSTGFGWPEFDVAPVWPAVVTSYADPQRYWMAVPVPPPPAPPPAIPTQVAAPGVTYRDWYGTPHWVSRLGRRITTIVLHGSEGLATLAWFADPKSKVSSHDVIHPNGVISRCVTYDRAAWHIGTALNAESIGVEMECPPPPAVPEWPKAQVDAAVAHVRELMRVFGLPLERVVRHADVFPAVSKDPRGFPWEAFKAALAQPPAQKEEIVEDTIRRAAWRLLSVPYSPLHAFPRFARENDLGAPLAPEADVTVEGATWRYQPFSKGIVAARVGAWHDCKVLRW